MRYPISLFPHAIPSKAFNRIRTAFSSYAFAAMAVLISVTFTNNVSAATRTVGAGKQYATPCNAFANAVDGDVIEINGNFTYAGDVCGIYANNLTIRGVNGRPKIDAAGRNALGKGTWVVSGNNVVVENVEMFGAAVPDQNGAALRLEGNNFTLRSSFLHDNENGILGGQSSSSNILIENSEFGHNGYGTGYTHNLYIGNAGSLTFRYNYSHDANVGHNLKSRALINTITYNRFSSTGPGESGTTASGQPSYEIDLPNAGTAYVIGNVIEQPLQNQNPTMLAYGEEGATNPGKDLYVVNNTFLNDDSSHGTFLLIGSDVNTAALMQNNIFAGVGTVSTQGFSIDKTNYRGLTPAFINRAAYNLLAAAGAPFASSGSVVGVSASGVSLSPTFQYQHLAAAVARPMTSALDIGAYQGTNIPASATLVQATNWIKCADENSTCTVNGTRQVRYGANGSFAYRTVTGSVSCNNATFGDAIPGVAKSCQYADDGAAQTTETWIGCGREGNTCSFSGTRQIRYGTNGTYAYRTTTGSIECTNAVFGDPVYGFVKACEFSSILK
jgi:hypothetical protein